MCGRADLQSLIFGVVIEGTPVCNHWLLRSAFVDQFLFDTLFPPPQDRLLPRQDDHGMILEKSQAIEIDTAPSFCCPSPRFAEFCAKPREKAKQFSGSGRDCQACKLPRKFAWTRTVLNLEYVVLPTADLSPFSICLRHSSSQTKGTK